MAYPQKIVTCCYCGSRAALVLKGKTTHELACSSCGAPLHDLKMLPKHRSGDRELFDGAKRKGKPSKPEAWGKKKKKKKSLGRFLLSEAFDVLEDILD